MNVGQPVIMQAANSEAQEPTEDVMDDADVADAFEARGADEVKQEASHKEVSKVREDKAR